MDLVQKAFRQLAKCSSLASLSPGAREATAWREAQLLVVRALGVRNPSDLFQLQRGARFREKGDLVVTYIPGDSNVGAEQYRSIAEERLDSYLQRRGKNEPLAHIIGSQQFWGLELLVNSSVLIPRPESEALVELTIEIEQEKIYDQGQSGKDVNITFLDVGTGSGCLLLSLLKEFPCSRGFGIDKSEKALNVAKENATRLGLAERTKFLIGDFTQPKFGISDEQWDHSVPSFDYVLSNPPYIPIAQKNDLPPDVKDYEPHDALFVDDEKGVSAFEKLAQRFGEEGYFKKDGHIIVEIGYGQENDVKKVFESYGLKKKRSKRDFTGKKRALAFTK